MVMTNIPSTFKKTNYIRLHRFVRLGDRSDTQVFTFVVPAQLTRGFINSAQSKEFIYGGQRWQLLLCYQLEDFIASDLSLGPTSTDKSKSTDASRDLNSIQCPPLQKILSNPLNVGIVLCGGLAGMRCKIESCRFTVLNRDSVSLNKTYEEKLFTFTADSPAYWKTGWLQVDRLTPEGFLFDDWTWLLEIELRGASTIYEECLSLSKAGTKKATNGNLRLESASFTYASKDWNVSLEWLPTEAKKAVINNVRPEETTTAVEREGCPTLKLHRHSRTNHWCRVRFRTTLVWGSIGESTVGPTDQLITSGSGASTTGYEIGDPKWFVKGIQQALGGKQRIKIVVEMLVAAPVSRIDLIPIAPLGGKNLARCKDPDGYDWIVLSDILGTLVRLKFFPIVEVHQVQDGANHTPTAADRPCESRCVSWNVHLIPFQSMRGVVRALSSTYVCHVPKFRCLTPANNYAHGPLLDAKEMMIQPEEVVEVALDLSVEHVCDKNAGYVNPTDNTMTIRVEWLQSQTLCHGHYNVYDDMLQAQRNQLWLALRTLQMENSALKRQLLASGALQATTTSSSLPNGPSSSSSSSLKPVTSKQSYVSRSSDMLPKSSTFVRSASDSYHSCQLKSPAAAPPSSSSVYKQCSLKLPTAVSTDEGCDWRQEEAPPPRNTRRRSSVNVLLDSGSGKPRRSLPTFAHRVNWRLQRRQHCQVEEDDDDAAGCSDGHSSCGDGSIFLTVNDIRVYSNLSSPARRPLGGYVSSGPSPHNLPSPTHLCHSSSTASTPCGRSLSRSPARAADSRPK